MQQQRPNAAKNKERKKENNSVYDMVQKNKISRNKFKQGSERFVQ